jgi:hypothetical protein
VRGRTFGVTSFSSGAPHKNQRNPMILKEFGHLLINTQAQKKTRSSGAGEVQN